MAVSELFRFFAERREYGMTVALYAAQERAGERYIAEPVVFSKDEGGIHTAPMLEVPEQQAQMLLDELWRCGFRPTRQQDGDGIKAHLADMRAIAFGKLNIDQPK